MLAGRRAASQRICFSMNGSGLVGFVKVSKNKPELVTVSEKIPQEWHNLGGFAVRPSTCRDFRTSRSSRNRPQERVGSLHRLTVDRS